MQNIIPTGLKCFEVIEIIDFIKGKFVIKLCKYWGEDTEGIVRCSFLKIGCKYGDENIKLWNHDKECNVNVYNNIVEPEYYFDLK